jgi:hypothetical protein
VPPLPFRDEFAGIDPARYPIEYIEKQVKSGFWRVWGNDKAAIIATIKRYPSGLREVQGIAAAGDLEEIVRLIPLAEEWGRSKGCAGAEIASKPAWAKIMATHGYRPAVVRLWKEF